jgi:hypothetical protein
VFTRTEAPTTTLAGLVVILAVLPPVVVGVVVAVSLEVDAAARRREAGLLFSAARRVSRRVRLVISAPITKTILFVELTAMAASVTA